MWTGRSYKSWPGLKKTPEERVCAALRGRVTCFLTRYHSVRDTYGRAAIRPDGRELVCFSWNNGYEQEGESKEDVRA